MFVPTVPTEPMVDPKDGNKTKPWENYFQQGQQNQQEALSDEGFWIPNVSSDPNSVTPPTTGGELAQIQASFGTQGGAKLGYLVFDPFEVNGGSSMAPRGQLKILLADGTFHKVTNT